MIGANARIDPSELEVLLKASGTLLELSQQAQGTRGIVVKSRLLTEESEEKISHAIHCAEAALLDVEKRN